MEIYTDDELKKKVGTEVFKTMNDMINAQDYENSVVLIIDKPFSGKNEATVAAILFSKIYAISNESGKPEIDFNKLNNYTEGQKTKELLAIVNTIFGFLNAMDNLKNGFQKTLQEICKILEKIDPEIVGRLMEGEERMS
ncbi:MAG: hypothetical protein BV456_06490 [Thermoplasmata archaeon M8B2D]|nr:MAG: hypothetical protein BV456_06490 [Thermoplasmata archaeon M8B2D]